MRCIHCGCEIESGMVYCPDCGKPVRTIETDSDITDKLVCEIDRVMNSGGSLRDIHDGVNIVDGEMKFTDPDSAADSVFEEDEEITAESVREDIRQDYENLDLNEDYDDVPVISIVRENDNADVYMDTDADMHSEPEPVPEQISVQDAPVQETDELPPKKQKASGTDIFLVIILIVMGLAAAAYLVFGIILRKDDTEPAINTASTSVSDSSEIQEKNTDEIISDLEDGKTYEAPLKITLSSKRGYRMYYTLDGSEPTANSTMYNGSFTLKERDITGESRDFTLTVYSFTGNGKQAGEYKCTFTMKKKEISAPVISPLSGKYDSDCEITVTAQQGAVIYYTYGSGDDPDENSEVYSGAIRMKRGSYVFKAVAYSDGRSSDISSAVFTLDIPAEYSYDQALEILSSELIKQGRMNDAMLTPGGGRIMISRNGRSIIDDESYYCFTVNEKDKDGKKISEEYYGVNDRSGLIIELEKQKNGQFAAKEENEE